eukprot:1147688-Pelagomonas_calceolata.AAC.3
MLESLLYVLGVGLELAGQGLPDSCHGVVGSMVEANLLVLHTMRRNEVVRSSTTLARQLHELNIQKRHIHFIEIKYCEDTRPAAQLEASQQQHSELCKQLQGAEMTLHTILLGVGGTIYTAHTLDNLKN